MRTRKIRLIATASAVGLLLAACSGSGSGDREDAVDNLVDNFGLAAEGSQAEAEDLANCIIDEFGEDRLGEVDNFDPDFEPSADEEEALGADVTAAFAECVGGDLTPDDEPTDDGETDTSPEATGDEAMAYGDDPDLDALYDECAETGAAACDELFFTSPVNSEYEEFGNTCGGRGIELSCDEVYGEGGGEDEEVEPIDCDAADVDGPCDYGDDADFDAMWDACEAGDGDACDELYNESPIGSRYEQFGDTCGDRGYEPACGDVYSTE